MEDELLTQLGHRIKYQRYVNKLAQTQLAEKADLSTHAISLIEAGKSNVKYTNLYAIAQAFNMSVSEFLSFKI